MMMMMMMMMMMITQVVTYLLSAHCLLIYFNVTQRGGSWNDKTHSISSQVVTTNQD